MSGPPPDPNALRRDRPSDQATWTLLPAEGRRVEPPAWPLIDVQPREWDLWRDMWSRPQAVMWERLGQQIEVAMFVRKLAEAELPQASVELQKVVRQYLDSLGLSVQGMLRNRWRIAPPVEQTVDTSPLATRRRPSARSRLKVVADGDGD
ncbi:hypothetical protein ACIRPH_30035 [Nocardiopsis sp. NPDC101807]|uniref:phage terminase small subunit n=1 Tax=Nocardiopsis sp. NPDC101807 TaxID=3364339 RepID=UPI00380841A7